MQPIGKDSSWSSTLRLTPFSLVQQSLNDCCRPSEIIWLEASLCFISQHDAGYSSSIDVEFPCRSHLIDYVTLLLLVIFLVLSETAQPFSKQIYHGETVDLVCR